MRKRTKLDWVMLLIVVGVAVLIIASSFHNTKKLAEVLGMPPLLAASIVEIAFTTFLFLRGRQRALGLNTPLFLHGLYFGLLALVTGVNMWGLSIENQAWGLIIGASISGLLWGMETTLVWLWTDSHRPHQKSLWEIKREADREAKEEKIIQEIEWKKYEAKLPSLSLIKKVRKREKEREKVVAEGLPQYFLQKPEPIKEIVAELERSEPKKFEVEQEPKTAEIVPLGGIGFHAETARKESKSERKKSPAPMFRPNQEKRQEALEVAIRLESELGRVPEPKELMEEGLTKHYATFARKELRKMRETE